MLTVVMGAPCSGKSTYVREHAKPGDIVIDFDKLAQALGSPTPHDHPDHIRMVAVKMRRAAIEEALRQHLQGYTVWIVDINPGPRMVAYRRVGAQIVTMTATPEELHERADRERPERWHQLIDQHLTTGSSYTPPARRPRRASGSRAW